MDRFERRKTWQDSLGTGLAEGIRNSFDRHQLNQIFQQMENSNNPHAAIQSILGSAISPQTKQTLVQGYVLPLMQEEALRRRRMLETSINQSVFGSSPLENAVGGLGQGGGSLGQGQAQQAGPMGQARQLPQQGGGGAINDDFLRRAAIAGVDVGTYLNQRHQQTNDYLLKEDQFSKYAAPLLNLSNEELPEFLEATRQFDSEINPSARLKKSKPVWDEYKKFKSMLAELPNIKNGALGTIEMLTGERKEKLAKLKAASSQAAKVLGKDVARDMLKQKGLGDVQAEKILNPLSKEDKSKIKAVVPELGLKLTPQEKEKKTKDRLKKVLKDLIRNDKSLVLINDKLPDAIQGKLFLQSIAELESEGVNLNDRQRNELLQLANKPKRSLNDIFAGIK